MLLERFNDSLGVVPFQLEGSQQVKGLTWLHKTQLNSKGDLRSAKDTFIGQHELAIIRDFASFEFVGLRDATSNHISAYKNYVPVYRVNATSGASFDYSSSAYGYCEIVNIVSNAFKSKLKLVVG